MVSILFLSLLFHSSSGFVLIKFDILRTRLSSQLEIATTFLLESTNISIVSPTFFLKSLSLDIGLFTFLSTFYISLTIKHIIISELERDYQTRFYVWQTQVPYIIATLHFHFLLMLLVDSWK